MKSTNEPFYELEIKTAHCFIEILINETPIFSHYKSDGVAVDYPINDAILSSGKQSIKVRILSATEDENIFKYATCELKIFAKEANIEALGRSLVYEIPMIDFKEKKLPLYENIYSFIANVPYKNAGWENSIDLKKNDEDLLLKELENHLQKIISIYNSRNEKEYEKFYKDRTIEHNRSFYLTSDEIKENKDSIFYGLPEKIESIDKRLYKLVFYGSNKLVSLQAKHQPAGFVFESINKGEYGFTEMVLFHKKGINSPLEVIR
ncbi:hypothetical protein J2Y38_002155 [Flavobacterium sp. 2755]|uniref:hypothetical protein n=1 Tax=Flavobacterium sp. 2755 TaxID=2817765 RepID=UPI0028631C6B|nr:hypothetical protein [Flavobacterium sp. 2755]MDR6761944.1 hypothetical protein [Flavobacterium sp. 2755]